MNSGIGDWTRRAPGRTAIGTRLSRPTDATKTVENATSKSGENASPAKWTRVVCVQPAAVKRNEWTRSTGRRAERELTRPRAENTHEQLRTSVLRRSDSSARSVTGCGGGGGEGGAEIAGRDDVRARAVGGRPAVASSAANRHGRHGARTISRHRAAAARSRGRVA